MQTRSSQDKLRVYPAPELHWIDMKNLTISTMSVTFVNELTARCRSTFPTNTGFAMRDASHEWWLAGSTSRFLMLLSSASMYQLSYAYCSWIVCLNPPPSTQYLAQNLFFEICKPSGFLRMLLNTRGKLNRGSGLWQPKLVVVYTYVDKKY